MYISNLTLLGLEESSRFNSLLCDIVNATHLHVLEMLWHDENFFTEDILKQTID